MVRRLFSVMLLALPGLAAAQPAPVTDHAALAAASARRFPQPVRVGDLLGQYLIKPVESQPVLGRVAAVTRQADGALAMVIRYGGTLGVGERFIAVPVEALALVGPSVAAVGVTPEQLDRFPAVGFPAPFTVPPDTVISVAIVRPFH